MANFYDHFSGHAALYNKYRPRYPQAMYDWLLSHVPARQLAWDCAAGGGQASLGLAPHFRRVIATDASIQQLKSAPPVANVRYILATAEAAPLPASSVDLITVAQALHWLDHDAFYAEVRRVARSGALLAAWSYQVFSVNAAVDAVLRPFYYDYLGNHWPPQRARVRDHYASLPFPFEEVQAPGFSMRPRWTRQDLLNQVSTWSAVRRHDAATGQSAVSVLEPQLTAAWPDADEQLDIDWPIVLRVGHI